MYSTREKNKKERETFAVKISLKGPLFYPQHFVFTETQNQELKL